MLPPTWKLPTSVFQVLCADVIAILIIIIALLHGNLLIYDKILLAAMNLIAQKDVRPEQMTPQIV